MVRGLGGGAAAGKDIRPEFQQFDQAGIAAEGIIEGEVAATDPGLVGEQEEAVAETTGADETLADPGEQLNPRGIGEVGDVDDKGPVAIKKERFKGLRAT